MTDLKEISPGVFEIPEEDMKRIKENQRKREQRQLKRKSSSRRYGGGSRNKYFSHEEVPIEELQ